jgi:pimeloyl-ACP methyl ester carboxylesterase
MSRQTFAALALSAGLAFAAPALAQTAETRAVPAPSALPAADYSHGQNWLCRPGRQDACAASQATTVVAADGTLSREAFHADPKAPIDCFYVYPTVSTEPTGNSDLTITAAETNVVDQQFARFGARCRLFAPMYRQVTLTALRGFMTGKPIPTDRALGYNDVVAAWNEYLAHDNHGRGVVLVGHSQGSGVLTQLIKNEIDGKPAQARLVSAILMGTSLPVPKGQDVGGAFKHIPVCHADDQIGCVIAFADFRADSPPPANSRFGKAPDGMQAVCANPSALGGGSGPIHAYLPAGVTPTSDPMVWSGAAKPIDTPFVSVPGMLTGECVADAHGSYLAVTVHPTPGGFKDIGGDVVIAGMVQKDWGLHLIDANLHIGRLVDIVGDETRTYLAKAGN